MSGNTNKETIFNIISDIPEDYTGIAIFKIFEDAARKEWYVEGKRHRIDGPALIHEDGSKSWYRNGKLHREDGPALDWKDGTTEWYRNGLLHREDGPAVISYCGLAKRPSNKTEEWWVNGKLHREDGPARIKNNCWQWWWRGMCCHGQKPIGDYIVIQDGLPSKVYWMRDRNFVTQKKVLTPEGIMYIPNLPGI